MPRSFDLVKKNVILLLDFNFDKDSEPANGWRNMNTCEEGEIYLRRIIYAEGRSKSYINGQPFPLQKIKELSEKLVHIHGQHQHQTLMQHPTHRQQLDQYANHQNLLDEVASYTNNINISNKK